MTKERQNEVLYVGKLCLSNNSNGLDAEGNRLKTPWTTTINMKRLGDQEWAEVGRWKIPSYYPVITHRNTSPTNVVLMIEDEKDDSVWQIELSRPDTNSTFIVKQVDGALIEK